MPRNVVARDSLSGLLRSSEVRLAYQERIVTRGVGSGNLGGGAPSEIEVAYADPIPLNPLAELWFDPDATLPTAVLLHVGDAPPDDDGALFWFNPSAMLPEEG